MAFTIIMLTIIIAIISTIVYLVWRHFTYWSRNGVRGPKFVDFAAYTKPYHIYSVEMVRKYGKIFGTYTIAGKMLHISEPQLIQDIMVRDFHSFPGHAKLYLGSTLFGLSLLFQSDERWKRIRNIISPAFSSAKLRSMLESMHEITDQLVDNLVNVANEDEPIDIRKYMGCFAMDVLTSCAYGVKTDSLNNADHQIVTNVKKLLQFDLNCPKIISVCAPSLAKLLRLELMDTKAVKYLNDITKKIVSERKRLQHNETKINKRRDFLQLMIDTEVNEENETTNEESNSFEENIGHSSKAERSLTSDELTAQAIFFFIAGYDTTSSTLSHCIHHLSVNQDCQRKLYEELQTINDFSYETLKNLKYLNAVISETLRLSPGLLRIDRQCVADYKLGDTGITIPAGVVVVFLPYALHRDADYFEDPEQFKPERFFAPKHHPYAYIPFGGGQRVCVGMRFVRNEMRVCIAKLIRKFKFEAMPGFEMQYFNGHPMHMIKQLLVMMKTRK